MLRALCDSGCQINLFTTDAVQSLRLRKSTMQTQILGLGGTHAAKGKLRTTLSSVLYPDTTDTVQLYVTSRLLGKLPQSVVDISHCLEIRRLPLADKSFDDPSNIDLIFGADFYGRIIRNGVRHFGNGLPAQRTTFGWIVFGQIKMPICNIAINDAAEATDALMDLLSKHWAMEETKQRRYLTKEEQLCEDIFNKTTIRNAQGRFIANIPIQLNAK